MNQETGNRGGRSNESTLGVVLIGVGGLLALSNMGVIGGMGGIVGLLVLGGLGAWLLSQYYGGRRQLWLLFAGFTLLGCGAATITGEYGGAWFLGITGLGFLTAWRENADRWWAVLPAGTLLTLAAVVVADASTRWISGGAVFFIGMAATFLALYALPRHPQSWAMFPAVASAALALIVWGASGTWTLPVLLIIAGLYMLRNGVPGSRPLSSPGGSAPAGKAETPAADGDKPVSHAQLPESIESTGPEIGEDWPAPKA